MVETVVIKRGTFRAELLMEALPLFTSDKFRRLMRLTKTAQWENAEALETLADEIRKRHALAAVAYGAAVRERDAGWVNIFPRGRRQPGDDKIRAENRRLDRKVQECKTRLKNWARIETIFKGEMNI